jgi:uncharacterized coiled-coil protein SlyX
MSNTKQIVTINELNELVTTLIAKIDAQQATIEELKSKIEPKRNEAQREMTDDDARRILTGDLATAKHKDAAATLGLSYGQVYSCRLEFTFKHIHKEMREANVKNIWVK